MGLGMQEILILGFCMLVPVLTGGILILVLLFGKMKQRPEQQDRDNE